MVSPVESSLPSHQAGHTRSLSAPHAGPPCAKNHPLYPTLEKTMDPSRTGATATAAMRQGRTEPRLLMLYCGAEMVVLALTEGITMPWTFNLKERSRMALNLQLLWGIIAMGEIFSCRHSFVPNRCSTSSRYTTSAKPSLTFAYTSACITLITPGSKADTCGSCSAAAIISVFDHTQPTSTGQPSRAYWRSIGPAGWCRALPLGNMRPLYSPSIGESSIAEAILALDADTHSKPCS